MTILSALISHLEASGVGVAGTDLFIDTKPASIESAIIVRRTGGTRDPECDGKLRRTDVQIVVTGIDYQTVEAKAEEVSKAIKLRQTEFPTESVFVYRSDPDQDPIPVGREDSGVETMVVNCEIIWRETT